jgi:hypothetical protein
MGRVASVSEFDEETVFELTVPDEPEEPVELRDALRDALLEGRDWRDGMEEGLCFGNWLWERWRPALEPAGLTWDQFADALVANRRELWLWLMGERQWTQFLEAQAGRIIRRLPAGSGPGTAPTT